MSPLILGDEPIVSDEEDRSEESDVSEKDVLQGIRLKMLEIWGLKFEKDIIYKDFKEIE